MSRMFVLTRHRRAWAAGPRARRLMWAWYRLYPRWRIWAWVWGRALVWSARPSAYALVAADDGASWQARCWRLVEWLLVTISAWAWPRADRLGTRLDRIGGLIDRLMERRDP